MVVRVCLLVALAGCDLVFPIDQDCYGSDFVEVCVARPLPPTGSIRDASIDTAAANTCLELSQDAGPVCVVGANEWRLANDLTVTGPHALVIVGNTIHIDSTLDLSGAVGGTGSELAICNDEKDAGSDRSGGYGGSHGTKGGEGGGASGGEAPRAQDDKRLRGGCSGGIGGGTPAARGGRGGGVVAILARQAITISASGRINASGEGGEGGGPMNGGAGGGAGGMIVLDAPTLTMQGILLANGGGGGQGGATTAGEKGDDPTAPDQPAAGGSGTSGGAGGGAGATGTSNGENGVGGVSIGGQGGGGGGVGVLFVLPSIQLDDPTRVSPRPES